MPILRRNVASVMIGLSIFMFTIAVTLNDSEILNVAESAFALNFLAILSVLFMAVGIYLAFSNKPMLRKARGHNFETTTGRRG
jgi:hypothetical protein